MIPTFNIFLGLYPDVSWSSYYQRITENPLTLPNGSAFRYSSKIISKRVSLYQRLQSLYKDFIYVKKCWPVPMLSINRAWISLHKISLFAKSF